MLFETVRSKGIWLRWDAAYGEWVQLPDSSRFGVYASASCANFEWGHSPAVDGYVLHNSANESRDEIFLETSKSAATERVLGAQEKCGRCGKTVYMAERLIATGKVQFYWPAAILLTYLHEARFDGYKRNFNLKEKARSFSITTRHYFQYILTII